MPSADVDVVVVGAGVAGLAAAAELRARSRSCVVLEAAARIGGRAWTTCPAALGGKPFDHGASWLHVADRNPLAPIAEAHGCTLLESSKVRSHRAFIGNHLADEAELAAYDQLHDRLFAHAEARIRSGGPDVSLAEAVADLPPDPWTATVLTWQGAIIAGADADALSVADWHINLLDGRNLAVQGGLGAMVSAALGLAAGPVRLGTPVTHISWQERGGGVAVETPRGTLTAGACIVTVSTGVLAAGAIRFSPALPVVVQEAIRALPMGLLSKVVLRAGGADRLDLPPFCSVEHQIGRLDEPAMMFHAWPFGYDHMIGFIGGRAAWSLAEAGPQAAEDFARAQLRTLFGTRADRAFAPGAIVTTWGTDPHFLGAYCYATPGHIAARDLLAQPLADGRLVFAGEACSSDGLAGTVGGAYVSGARAAAQAACHFSR